MPSRERTPLMTEILWGVATTLVAIALAVGGFLWFLSLYFGL